MHNLTTHASIQAQRRGISKETIELVMELGDRKVRLPGNAFSLSLSPRRLDELADSGLPVSSLERARGIALVVAGDDLSTVITAQHVIRRVKHH